MAVDTRLRSVRQSVGEQASRPDEAANQTSERRVRPGLRTSKAKKHKGEEEVSNETPRQARATLVLSVLTLVLAAALVGRTIHTSMTIRALEEEIAETKAYADAVGGWCMALCAGDERTKPAEDPQE
jgi:hypothetical protein